MSGFDDLADDYDQGRIGYSPELYDTLAGYGVRAGVRVLDVACGTGLASGPLVDNGCVVTGVDISEPMLAKARARYPTATWVRADAAALPFEAASFDVALSAQAIHHVGAVKALREMQRVLQRGGVVAVWWKFLAHQDPVRALRVEVTRDLGVGSLETSIGGFREFYAAPLVGAQVRVLPWQAVVPLSTYLAYERSRATVRARCGARSDEYVARLESRLREFVGSGDPRVPLNYVQYLYLARAA